MDLPLPATEQRLQRRYQRLVQEHFGQAQATAAGPRAVPRRQAQAFASTQAAWCFYHNPRLTLPQLAGPLLDTARAAAASCDRFCLVVHDGSHLDYAAHADKADRVRVALGKGDSLGYLLRTALLVSGRDGEPLAPLCQDLRAADGVHSSRHDGPLPPASRLDELAPVLAFVRDQRLARPAVHVIDREADSVAHYRDWHAAGHRFLVRADDRLVRHEGAERPLRCVVRRLRRRGAFRYAREVLFRGRPARQEVAEAAVVLERPACLKRKGADGKKRRRKVAGPPLPVRLVVSQVRDARGRQQAEWLLLTNVPAEVTAEEVALWYYWRWRVESFFKLLKGAGQQVEHWQQQTAAALSRRLLAAGRARVLVWGLARDPSPEAAALRSLLVRLSGRQMAWGVAFTGPALLAGLWVLLAVVEVLDQYPVDELRSWAALILPGRRAPDTG